MGGVARKPLLDGLSDARELGIIIIMDENEAGGGKFAFDEAEGIADRLIEVAVEKSKGNLVGQVGGGEVGKPSFFDDGDG